MTLAVIVIAGALAGLSPGALGGGGSVRTAPAAPPASPHQTPNP